MSLEVSDLKLFVSSFTSGSCVGYGTVQFNETISIRFLVMKSAQNGGTFISWPKRKKEKDDTEVWENEVSFVTMEQKNQIDGHILAEFNKKLLVEGVPKASGPKIVIKNSPKPEIQESKSQAAPSNEATQQQSEATGSAGRKVTWR